MDLIVLRHGEAGKRIEAAGRDFERALTVSGKKEVEEVAASLGRLGVDVDLVVASPLRRAKETAVIASKVLEKEDAIEVWDELKPEGETQALYRRLSGLKRDSTVMLVGHEPYLSEMIGELVAGSRGVRIVLKKAGAARVVVTSFTPKPSGELRWLMTPRQMRKLARSN